MCGLEMWNGVRHMFRLLAGGADLANRRERRGLARLPHSQREIFMRVSTWELKGCCFPELEALFNVMIIAIPF